MRSTARSGEDERAASNGDTAGVVAPPPLLFFVAILAGLALHLLFRLALLPPRLAIALGAPIVVGSLVLGIWAMREFRRAGTPVPVSEPSTALVTAGPYRFSRNPIYLALSLLHLGIAIWANSAWLLLALAAVLVVMTHGVIAREERYLERKFGKPYLDYKAAVRRWL
jgi:protein-S-isoprenylcysteine O-methyltransferase Ste14